MTRNHDALATTLLALLLGGLCGCSREPAPVPGAEGSAAGSRPPRTLPLPAPTSQRPESPTPAAATGRLTWDVPVTWVEEPPRTQMRIAQYRVPGPAGDGECIVHYFGPGQGGDARANAARWARQFEQPDGGSSEDRMSVEDLTGTAVPVQLVEVSGTYDGGMTMTDAPAEKKPGYRLLGAIAEGPDAPWFFKLTGPEKSVRAQRDAFVQMLRSLRPSSRE